MKKLIILSFLLISAAASFAQNDFKSYITTAKTAYGGGKLEETHFALEQAMQELDLIIGKEVLKLLPPKIDTMGMNPKDDHVMANVSFVGATISRSYGSDTSGAKIEIINNSPMLGSLNALLNMPMMGGMMRDENNKTVKVQGYKGRLEKQDRGDNRKPTYVLNIPLSSALVTFTVNGTTENDMMNLANTIPMQQIAKLVQ